jgi:hypothetical protein
MPVPVVGPVPIAPCNWDIDTVCCSTWGDNPELLQAAATEYATLVLWAATGRRYGLCEYTVLPCTDTGCVDSGGLWFQDGEWFPYIFNGVWFNGCFCGSCNGSCDCDNRSKVWLPGPVDSITTVLVDGVAVDPGLYQVEDRQWLVRTDGESWPTGTGTTAFEVTYFRGIAVPVALMVAAGTLACEYAKACQGAECRLPKRATNISRSGVQITLQNLDDFLMAGLTGIPEVDMVIKALNPRGLTHRPRLFSPDVPRVRTVTSP